MTDSKMMSRYSHRYNACVDNSPDRIWTIVRRRFRICTSKYAAIYLLFGMILFILVILMVEIDILGFVNIHLMLNPFGAHSAKVRILEQTINTNSTEVSLLSETNANMLILHSQVFSPSGQTNETTTNDQFILLSPSSPGMHHETHNEIIAHENETLERKSPLKEILLWTSYYIDPYYGLNEYGQGGFIKNKCPVNTCTLTSDKTRLKSADSVVIHMRNHDMNPLPKRQSANQVFVFYLFEAPPASFWHERVSVPEADKGSFNLTVTYRYDSDIVQPGTGTPFVKEEEPKPYIVKTPLRDRPGTVIWISSHCETKGMREKYIKALATYIHVDIYGKCGWLNCTLHEPCDNNFDKMYKFYISAENAVCTDYVTEKINKALNKEIIPIVYGGLDYEKRLPPHSHINMAKFPSPQQLALYINNLVENESEYWKYFDWKMKYGRDGVPKEVLMCRLCEKLHDPNYHKVYPDIVKWWTEGMCNTEFMDNMISEDLV